MVAVRGANDGLIHLALLAITTQPMRFDGRSYAEQDLASIAHLLREGDRKGAAPHVDQPVDFANIRARLMALDELVTLGPQQIDAQANTSTMHQRLLGDRFAKLS